MKPSVDQMVSVLQDSLLPFDDHLALYVLGSYGSTPVVFDELDVVVLLDDPELTPESTLAWRLWKACEAMPVPTHANICNGFVPRSHSIPLTLHCAIYSRTELLQRRPQIIKAIRDTRASFGQCSWASDLAQIRWTLLETLQGPWGPKGVTATLQNGYWCVWCWLKDRRAFEKRQVTLRTDDPWCHVELLWHSASKLTHNILLYCHGSDEIHGLRKCEDALRSLRVIVDDMRNGSSPNALIATARSAWRKWFSVFGSLADTLIRSEER